MEAVLIPDAADVIGKAAVGAFRVAGQVEEAPSAIIARVGEFEPLNFENRLISTTCAVKV
jgi:hypothetical protein